MHSHAKHGNEKKKINMKTFKEIVDQARTTITELFPWDVEERAEKNKELLIVDIREQSEFDKCHVKDSLFVPRGILETACEAEYDDALPVLVNGRDKEIVVICRSGNRSVLVTQMMQELGFTNVSSMKTGLRGWNDYDLALYDINDNQLDADDVEEMLNVGFFASE
jgi:rhodanese-related sulfurtransferase